MKTESINITIKTLNNLIKFLASPEEKLFRFD